MKEHAMEHTMQGKEIDPVCGMAVEPEKARAIAEYKGKKYYFCAPGCKTQFEKEPEKYIKNIPEKK